MFIYTKTVEKHYLQNNFLKKLMWLLKCWTLNALKKLYFNYTYSKTNLTVKIQTKMTYKNWALENGNKKCADYSFLILYNILTFLNLFSNQ